jgi:hypothetical protein
VSKFESRGADLFNNALGPWREMHGFAAAIMRSASARDPSITFKPMQQGHERWFFDAEMGSDLCLRQRTRRDRQVHERTPFRLTQAHWLEPLVQFQPPGPRSPVEEWTEKIDIVSLHGWKIVSLLTNSNSLALSMPALTRS